VRKIAPRGESPSGRSVSSAKSIIKIMFFSTMPMRKTTPTVAMMLNPV